MDPKNPTTNQPGSDTTTNNSPTPVDVNTVPNTPLPTTSQTEDIPQPIAVSPVMTQSTPQNTNPQNSGFTQTQPSQSSGIIPPQEKKGKGKLFAAIGGVILLLIAITAGVFFVRQRQSLTNPAAPSFTYHGGYYLQLASSNADINGNLTPTGYDGIGDCDPVLGICRAKNRFTGQDYTSGYVEKWTCNGKSMACGSTDTATTLVYHPANAPIQYIWEDANPPSCNQTTQLDIYDNTGGTLVGWMVWYSGDCPVGASPIPTPIPSPVPTPIPSVIPTPSISPTPVPTPSLTPSPSPSISPSPSPSISPTPTPAQGAVAVTPSPTPKATPKPSPSPIAELPPAGNSVPLIVASGTGILLLIVGLVLAL